MLGVLVIVSFGCGQERQIPVAMRNEKLLQLPPGATQLVRDQRGDTDAGIVAVSSGAYIQSVIAAPQTTDELTAYYLTVDPTLHKEPQSHGDALVSRSAQRTVEIAISDQPLRATNETAARRGGPSTHAYARVTVNKPAP